MGDQYTYTPLVAVAVPAHRRKAGRPVAGALLALVAIYVIMFAIPKAVPVHYPEENTTFHPLTATKVATIIEDRPLDTLVPLLLQFSTVLGPEWPIILYTSQDTLPTSPPFQRAINQSRITIRSLPPDVHVESREGVSEFLTQPWLWEQLAPAKHVLLFQADSILCSNSALRVEDFLEYDFVGAPTDASIGHGYNGGLSLRNRTMLLDIISTSSWKDEKLDAEKNSTDPANPTDPVFEFEDEWFYKKMVKRYAVLPSLDVAQTFAVGPMFYDRPLGYLDADRWQGDEMKKIDRWCPEHRLASKDLIAAR
ncbi:hypothetical protein BP6252_07983 [Coleophoma cylindrospora]|uniref:DUF5672 domain-containing protein n=1 Tax=Coleophoma cylindrospora TaxID=1849047 RepID=A0A3D8RBR0_9HELO|nr:hypothetical protein BP6252_07983 [Coleophoma cylindrospora]